MIGDVLQDLRYGLRSLRRRPAFAALVATTLGLGIGANGAIFSVVNAVLLRELPVGDPGGLVMFSPGVIMGRADTLTGARSTVELFAHPLYQRLRADLSGPVGGRLPAPFTDLAAHDSLSTSAILSWRGPADEASGDHARRRWVTANYFDVVGVPAFRGRTFIAAEDARPGADPVAVLSHAFWLRRFGGDPALVGARVRINARPHVVIGVAAPGFIGLNIGNPTDVWVPLDHMTDEFISERALLTDRKQSWLNVVGRLAPGATLGAAEAHANVTLRHYLSDEPALAREARERAAARIALVPGALGGSGLREQYRAPLMVLMTGVGLLLLIVCLNVSHLLLARATERQREMGIRTALGASRARIVRQLLAEGILLAALGTIAGVLLRGWLAAALVALVMRGQPSYSPLVLELGADARVLGFVASIALVTALVLGLVPAWQASRTDPQRALRAGSLAVAGGPRRALGRVLLTSQVATSLVLLVAAGLLAGSLGRLRAADLGFEQERLLLVRISTEFGRLSHAQALGLQEDLLARVKALPGVRNASLSYACDLPGCGQQVSLAAPGGSLTVPARLGTVSHGFFETTGLTLARGRGFTPVDRANAPRVAVINETLAGQLFPGGEAVGRRFRLDGPGLALPGQPRELEVVGVIKDARVFGPRRISPTPLAFVPAAQSPKFVGQLEVRTFGDPAALAERVRRTVLEVNPHLPVRNLRSMRTQLDRELTGERLVATLSSAFGAAALLLVCVGLYGVIAQWALQRTREIGVRMALGATTAGVRWLVLRQALAMVGVGVALGIPAALGAAQGFRRFLYGLSPTDPATVAAAVAVMFAIAAAAAYLPARRASRVDPMQALRGE